MIQVRHIFVSHPPHEKGQVTIWLSLRSVKNVKKQLEVSDLNQDYVGLCMAYLEVKWDITKISTFRYACFGASKCL